VSRVNRDESGGHTRNVPTSDEAVDRPTVGIVVQDNYPLDRDVRTRKLAKALDDGGWEVRVLARNSLDDPDRGRIRDEHPSATEDIGYAVVSRFSWLLATPLYPVIAAKLPANPFWLLWLAFQFRAADVDVVVACDMRAGLPGILAAKLAGVPAILDLRENFAELAQNKRLTGLIDRIALNVTLVSTIERLTVRSADHVWVVANERKEALINDGVASSSVTVVGNTPYLRELTEFADTVTSERFGWPGFTLVYVGSINEFRGLDLVIEGLAAVDELDGRPIHFAVAGDGPDRERLERLAERLGVTDRVHFLGWIDPSEVPAFLAAGDVGVIPHVVTTYTNQTVPNKLFDYMVAELPVLTTPCTPVARIVESTDCGRVLPADPDPSETAETIRWMAGSDRHDEWAANGRRAVERQYNWETTVERARATLRERVVCPESTPVS
jgi:glycosyltransferase involved in cell wall biosynthesis